MNRKAVAAILALPFIAGVASAADGPELEVQALKRAKLPLVEAIRLAEKDGGGPAIDAEFDPLEYGSEYEIKVMSADGKQVRELKIDAKTAEVVKTENEPFETVFARMHSDSIENAPMDLATAVVTAQKMAGGPALEAEIDTQRDTVVYNIKVAKGDTIQEVRLDAAGKVASAD